MSSKSLNRVILIGNLTRDPELKYTATGTAVCSFGIATNRSWTTNDGQTKEDVQFHRIVAWQKLGELCAKLLSKGRKIYCEGRLVYRSYTTKDGTERQVSEIVLNDFVLFDDKMRSEGKAQPDEVQNEGENDEIPMDEDLDNLDVLSSEEKPEKDKEKPKKESKKTEEDELTDSDIPF